MVVNAFHSKIVSMPTATIPPAIPEEEGTMKKDSISTKLYLTNYNPKVVWLNNYWADPLLFVLIYVEKHFLWSILAPGVQLVGKCIFTEAVIFMRAVHPVTGYSRGQFFFVFKLQLTGLQAKVWMFIVFFIKSLHQITTAES